MTAQTVFLAEVGKVTRHDGITAREANRFLVLQSIDVAVPRTDPAGAEHLETPFYPLAQLAAIAEAEVGGDEGHEEIIGHGRCEAAGGWLTKYAGVSSETRSSFVLRYPRS
jgi:hypothetical protein